jgi:FemAB-related protein (PEP-CTERM system-associated)
MNTPAAKLETASSRDSVPDVSVQKLTPALASEWDAFVESCPNATFFHLAGWKDVIESVFGHRCYYLLAKSDQEVTGVLPLVHMKSLLFGNALISTPILAYGGVATEDGKVLATLEDEACALAEELKVDYLELRNRESRHPDWPTKQLYVTFRKTLEADVEANLLSIPRKQRAMVRKGMKSGLKAEFDTSNERFYAAYSESFRNLGTPVFSRAYFDRIREVFKDRSDILVVTHDGGLVSSVMSFYFRDEVLPYFGGGTALARQLKGNDFMYWELMRHCCERGVRVFDFGRSKQGTGTYSFKKNWGFEPTPLFYEYYLVKAKQVPDISPMNPKYRMFIEAWKRLPLPIANRIGPWLARNLG